MPRKSKATIAKEKAAAEAAAKEAAAEAKAEEDKEPMDLSLHSLNKMAGKWRKE